MVTYIYFVLHTLNPPTQTCKEPHDFYIVAMVVVVFYLFIYLGRTFMKQVLCL